MRGFAGSGLRVRRSEIQGAGFEVSRIVVSGSGLRVRRSEIQGARFEVSRIVVSGAWFRAAGVSRFWVRGSGCRVSGPGFCGSEFHG